MKRILIFSGILLICISVANAQQINNLATYHLNRYLQNPAAAGSNPYLFISASYAKNWSGINGSPETGNLSVHSLVSPKNALGINLFNENTGLSGKTSMEASYACHFPISENGTKISFGVSALVSQYKLFKDKFIVDDPSDETIKYAHNSVVAPDAAFGVSLYRENKFYFDLSATQLLGRKVSFINSENLENIQVRHYAVGAGFQFQTGENLSIEPSLLVRATESMTYQLEAGAKGIIKKAFSIGCYYRTHDAIMPFIGYDAKNMMFAYSYGIVSGAIGKHTTGSHEIMLIIKINNAKPNL